MTEEITKENAWQFLIETFAKAGKGSKKYMSDKERLYFLSASGAQKFKRKALGICGNTCIKSLDQISALFLETGIASSLDEARELVPKVTRANELGYESSRGGSVFGISYLKFREVKGPKGDTKYQIIAGAWDGGI